MYISCSFSKMQSLSFYPSNQLAQQTSLLMKSKVALWPNLFCLYQAVQTQAQNSIQRPIFLWAVSDTGMNLLTSKEHMYEASRCSYCWWFRNHQLRLVGLSHYLRQFFIHPRWLVSRISEPSRFGSNAPCIGLDTAHGQRQPFGHLATSYTKSWVE